MNLNTICDNKGATKSRKRIGRGIGSGSGKTGGRGGKGQTARSGVRIKGFEGGQMPLHRRLPKRGFNKPNRLVYNEVNLVRIQKAIDEGKLPLSGTLTVESLVGVGLCRRALDGVRLLGGEGLSAKLDFEVAGVSKPARAAIEALGGSVRLVS